jgi:hypothetical protein
VRFAVAAVFAVAIWSYVPGLTTWLLRDARGSTKRSAGDRGLIEPAFSRASGPPDL